MPFPYTISFPNDQNARVANLKHLSHFFVKPYKDQDKNIRKIPVIPLPKSIVSTPALNDIIPEYNVHTKKKTDIAIYRIL